MKKWTKFQTKAQKYSKVHFIREIWCSNRETGRFDEKLGDSLENRRVGRYAYVPVVHSANYGRQYLIQVIANIIGYFT